MSPLSTEDDHELKGCNKGCNKNKPKYPGFKNLTAPPSAMVKAAKERRQQAARKP